MTTSTVVEPTCSGMRSSVIGWRVSVQAPARIITRRATRSGTGTSGRSRRPRVRRDCSNRFRARTLNLSSKSFRLPDQLLDGHQALAPEAWVSEIDIHPAEEYVRPVGAAGLEKRQVALGKIDGILAIPGIKRQHEQLTKRVGIDVARRVKEMRDVAPPEAVVLAERHAALKHILLRRNPVLGIIVGGELARLPSRRVDAILEAVHRNLPEYGCDGVIDLTDHHREPGARRFFALKQALKNQHLPEDRRHLGRRERGVRLQHALRAGKILMNSMPELMGECLHVSDLPREVHQITGMRTGHDVVTDSATALTRSRGSIDPSLPEELARNMAYFGMEF